MLNFRNQKILDTIGKYLREGKSTKKVSACIALGITLGIFPVLGTTTLLCAAAAIVFRLNLPLIQIINYAVYPLQLILLAFFYGAGGWLFTDRSSAYSGLEIVEMLQDDMWGSITALWDLTLSAVMLWLLTGPILALLLYTVLKPAIRKLPPKQPGPISSLESPD
jgi:uncharacterized protein (DUF2062 family)